MREACQGNERDEELMKLAYKLLILLAIGHLSLDG
jgi:hypothetical protein